MKFFPKSLCALALGFASTICTADSTEGNAANFTEVAKQVAQLGNPQSTLVVFDDDDTLTMMSCPDQKNIKTCQYLGGPAWFSWQQDNIQNGKKPQVAKTFDELLNVSTLLFAMNKMVYTSNDEAEVLGQFTQQGVRILAETARGNSTASATEQQFASLVVGKQNLLELFASNALVFNGLTSKASPYIPCNLKNFRSITYQQGIMYLSGQDKGKMLKCILDEYNMQQHAQRINQVVFLDDTHANVTAVVDAFKDQPNYKVIALNYTKLDAHKIALTQGKMAKQYQTQAMKQWNAIKNTMQQTLQKPSVN